MHRLPRRIFEKIAFCTNTGCWLWAAKWDSGDGYGKVRYEGKCEMVHRLIYRLLVGPIPAGLVLDHKCRQRICCNPDHLELVTQAENVYRGEAKLFERVVEN